jgi:hypothetical protein
MSKREEALTSVEMKKEFFKGNEREVVTLYL